MAKDDYHVILYDVIIGKHYDADFENWEDLTNELLDVLGVQLEELE